METQLDLKKEYGLLRMKYDLPEFEAITQDFDVEKLYDKETLFLAREIRRVINEKITAYTHLFETLINPTGPPMFVFQILKNVSAQDKEKMQYLYKTLSKIQLKTMKLDTVYSEKNEIDFIGNTFEIWQDIKLKVYGLFESFEKNLENGNISKKQSYFD
jgi:type I restriction-modification system DNA methylase subunit